MPSPPALHHDVYYHIYNRGNNREDLFVEERNYAHFLNLYGRYIEPVAETFAYCLLRNHFHCLVCIKSEEEIIESLKDSKAFQVSRQYSNLFNAYAKAINTSYGRTGSLFQHPFGRVPITGSSQFFQVVIYIHHNPQKHGLITDFRNWKHSSYQTLLSTGSTRLRRDIVMDWFGGRDSFVQLHNSWPGEGEDPKGLQDL